MALTSLRSLFSVAVMATVFWTTAQHRTTTSLRVMSVSGSADEEWFGFMAYPGAHDLCSQSVLGTGGEQILWRSYASKDKPSKVIAFYVKREGNVQGRPRKTKRVGNTLTSRRGNRVLSVQPADSVYPQCSHNPGAGERTVIVISRMIGRQTIEGLTRPSVPQWDAGARVRSHSMVVVPLSELFLMS
jgi:hypothetical protein